MRVLSEQGAWWSRSTIPEVLDRQAEHTADGIFLHLDGQALTYGELRERSVRGAHALASLGVGAGDRVGIMMATSPEWVVTWFAAARLGAVTVPVNTANRGDFLSNQLADAGTGVLAVDRSLLERLSEVASEVPSLHHVLFRDDGSAGMAGVENDMTADTMKAELLPIGVLAEEARTGGFPGGVEQPAGQVPSWDAPAAVYYTSGTTGRSKGVVSSHHYLLSAAAAMVECWRLQATETVYAPLPLFHLSAVGSVLGPLIAGGTGVIDKAFSVSQTWDRVREVGANGIALAGAMVVMLWNLPPDARDGELPIRFLSAAPVPGEIYRAVEQRYGCKVVTCYGLSEAFPVTLAGVEDDNPPGTSGRPNPRLEVAVVDDDDVPVPAGAVGEIVCRPCQPHVIFEGYHERPAETIAQTRNLWFHTGDLGRMDGMGGLCYVDRKNDAMRRRGENISSFEVEQAILSHPAIAEVAAIGVPSDLGEDDVMVCLTTTHRAELDLAEFMDFCSAKMPYFAVPRYVEVMQELPKNAMGRVLKPTLRERGVSPATWDREQAGYVVKR